MREAGQPEEAIRSFRERVRASRRRRVGDAPERGARAGRRRRRARRSCPTPTRDALDRVAVVKLNGGLATTMGLRSPKSLVEARDGRSFLDIIIGQHAGAATALRRATPARADEQPGDARGHDAGARVTSGSRRRTAGPLPPEHGAQARRRVTRARQLAARAVARMGPARTRRRVPLAAQLGDARRRCSSTGFRYAMISNADNLGATTDARIAVAHGARRDPVPDGGGAREPRPTARAVTSRAGAPTVSSCCARPRRRRPRTRSRSVTTVAGGTTTRTACGSICAC